MMWRMRASRLTLHSAGEVSLHLLQRLLTFDPQRRASADEALVHEFFANFDGRASVRGLFHSQSLPFCQVACTRAHVGIKQTKATRLAGAYGGGCVMFTIGQKVKLFDGRLPEAACRDRRPG